MLVLGGAMGPVEAAPAAETSTTAPAATSLSKRQAAIPPIAAFMATGDMPRLRTALNAGLDAGLTVSETKEILVHLYAYAGFPRSLNALTELMKVMEERRGRGITDAPGREPSKPAPTGAALLATGTANQTRISGAPVKGPVFEFAPVINTFCKPTCSATASSAITSTGKAASWPPSAPWPRRTDSNPSWGRTSRPA